jgi:hypothetical protein
MPSILNLKFKVGFPAGQHVGYVTYGFSQGNKSFVPFSNLSDVDSLTKTWKVRRFYRYPTAYLLGVSGMHEGCWLP